MNHAIRTTFALTIATPVVMFVGEVAAQTAPRNFEVAAIRSAAMPTPETFRGGQFRTGTTITDSTADFEFVTLADLIPYAYRVKSFQVAGPSSIRESRWNIRAKLPAGASRNDVPEMVQALLADRFKLKVHREKRDQPVYELVVAKGGPKLTKVEGDTTAAESAAALPGLGGIFPPFGGPPGGRGAGDGRGQGDGRGGDGRGGDGPGGRGMILGNGDVRITPNDDECGMRLEFTKLTMAGFADTLTPFLDRPVIDGTNLEGSYKASLKLPMEVMFAMMQNQIRNGGLPPPPDGGPGGRGPGGGGPGGDGRGPGGRGPGNCDPGANFGANSPDNSNAALFQAVQQLGLRLQARKAPFDTIVVDHVEKEPTDN